MSQEPSFNEWDMIRHIAPEAIVSGGGVVVGIGDDAAVVDAPAGEQLVLTTDAVIEGVHFDAGTEPERIGNKAAGRLLSDLAAMGATPRYLLFNMVLGDCSDKVVWSRLYDGIRKAGERWGCRIVGGDLSAGHPFSIHGFGVGLVPEGRAVLRSGAEPGDLLYVTGSLGGSTQGKHLDFSPRVDEGIWLGEAGRACAMIDVSDGLGTDLRHLMRMSEVGADIDAGSLPVSDVLDEISDPAARIHHALFDGEDYELLFAVRPDRGDRLEEAWASVFSTSCSRIGRVTETPGALQLQYPDGRVEILSGTGYDHLSGE